jgi:hypothetical protein
MGDFDNTNGLFDHQQSTATQQQAAKSVRATSGTRRQIVYRAFLEAGERGLTDDELGAALEASKDTRRWTYGDFAPRRRELVARRLVKDSGQTRTASSGSPQIVWVAV